jgi:hypothetical protein
MITCITSVSRESDLLPHFVAHYLLAGVDNFVIALNDTRPGTREELEQRIAELDGVPIRVVPASPRWRETGVEGANKEETRALHLDTATEWVVYADLDEFVVTPDGGFTELVRAARADGWLWAPGELVDRVAADGSLAELLPDVPLEEQYPVRAHVTRDVCRANCGKVPLAHRRLEIRSGHHGVFDDAQPQAPVTLEVAHYKWRAGVVEAIERRVALYEQRGLLARAADSVRFLEHYREHGRI